MENVKPKALDIIDELDGRDAILLEDNGRVGDQRCRLWEVCGTLAIETNGNTIWGESLANAEWVDALIGCGLLAPARGRG